MAGTLTIPVVYAAGRRWVGESPAVVAAFLLAVNPFHIWYSQEVRGYILLMLMGVLAMWAFTVEVRVRGRRSFAVHVLANLGACLCSFGGLFLLPAQGLLALVAAWRRDYPIWRFILAQVIVLVCLVNYAAEFTTTVDPETVVGLGDVAVEDRLRGANTFSILAPLHSLYAYCVGLTVGPAVNEMNRLLAFSTFRPHVPLMVAATIAFGITGLAGFLRGRRIPGWTGFLLLWLVVPILCTSLLAYLNVKVYNVRYPAVGFMAWIYLLAVGLCGWRRREWSLALGLLVAGLSLTSRVNLHRESRYWRPDARAAAELVHREAQPGDTILVYTIIEPFVHYYNWVHEGPIDVQTIYLWHFETEERYENMLEDLAVGPGRLWVVRYRSWYIDATDRLTRTLTDRLDHLERWHFPELPVDLYQQVPAQEWERSPSR